MPWRHKNKRWANNDARGPVPSGAICLDCGKRSGQHFGEDCSECPIEAVVAITQRPTIKWKKIMQSSANDKRLAEALYGKPGPRIPVINGVWKNSKDVIVVGDLKTYDALCDNCGFRYGNHYGSVDAAAKCPNTDRIKSATEALKNMKKIKAEKMPRVPKGCLLPRVYRPR